jgi:DNA-directed RNA polymerase subunit RPC12/RpoP
MAIRGSRKYRCGACKEESFHHWIHANRAAGVRCPGCGSRDMTLTSAEAQADAASLQRVRVAGGTRSASLPSRLATAKKKAT